jgi:hypothetical protein
VSNRDTVPSLEHLVRLSDDTGIIQHATELVPNRSTGYCTDDVARAFMVALMYLRLRPEDPTAQRLANVYLSFLFDAQIEGDGRFHNFMDYNRTWLDEIGTNDSCGRAMWGLGFGMRFAPDTASRRVCRAIFEGSPTRRSPTPNQTTEAHCERSPMRQLLGTKPRAPMIGNGSKIS